MPWSKGTRLDAGPGGGRGHTILLVDDSDLVRSLIRELVLETGAHVIDVALPAAAIDLARRSEQTVHLLITDLTLPGMSGIDLALQLRRHWPDLKVLLISADPGAAIYLYRIPGASF